MAGLFDLLNSDDAKFGIGLLAAAGPSATPLSFGQRLQGAMQGMEADKANKLKLDLVKAQIDNFNSEVAQRAAATQKMNDGLKFVAGMMNRGTYQPGQLGSGTAGITPNDNPFAPAQARGLSAATPEDIATAKAYGFDFIEPWKIAKEGFEQKPGTFRLDASTGRSKYIGDPTKGITYDNGRVGLMPGFADATTATTLASELPKALLSAAGTVNLRNNEDGTQSPVSALSENPTLQALIGRLSGGGLPPQGVAGPAAMPPAASIAPAGASSVSPQDQRTRDAESIQMILSELANNPTIPADQRAGLEREIARLSASQGQQGFPTPSLVRVAGSSGSPRYGMTNEQAAAADAKKAGAVKQAESDVRPMEQRKSEIAAANYMLSVIDQTLRHPGLPTATGASGTFDPRNYLPGTDAKGFHSLMDQVRGGTFMQAYTNLKGGGQITEVEGKKAENAIARLNTSQSTEDVRAALKELRQVVNNGIMRMKSAGNTGGATASFDGDNSEMVKTQPLPKEPSAKNLEKGVVYETPRGKARWTGIQFEVVKD